MPTMLDPQGPVDRVLELLHTGQHKLALNLCDKALKKAKDNEKLLVRPTRRLDPFSHSPSTSLDPEDCHPTQLAGSSAPRARLERFRLIA